MKRAIAVFAAGVLSAAMIASLAACAEEPNDVADNAEDMVSERVGSRADWEAAFSDPTQGAGDHSYTFNNANYCIESETRMTASNAAAVITRELVVAEEKVHRYQSTEMYINNMEEAASSIVRDVYYAADVSRYQYYSQGEDGSWMKSTLSRLDISLIETTAQTGSLTEYADEYDQFIWSDEKQGYCKSVSLTGVLGTPVTATLTLKLQGGRIAAMIISDAVPTESDNASVSISVSVMITYGGQSVTLPSV